MFQQASVKQGASIGGWFCFAIGVGIMWFSVWMFFVYVPLFLVAFILAIIALAQRRIASGIALLMTVILVPGCLWFFLSATRFTSFMKDVDKQMSESRTEQQPFPAETYQSTTDQKAKLLTSEDIPKMPTTTSLVAQEAGKEKKETLRNEDPWERLQKESVGNLHAWEITIGAQKSLNLQISPNLHPSFSRDGKLVAVLRELDFGNTEILLISLDSHAILERWTPQEWPSAIAWSPDGGRLAYLFTNSTDAIAVYDREKKQEHRVQLPKPLGFGTIGLLWLEQDQLLHRTRSAVETLSLDTLQVKISAQESNEELNRIWHEFLTKHSNKHPYCDIENELNASNGEITLYVRELNSTFKKALAHPLPLTSKAYPSPDLHHIFLLSGGAWSHLILKARKPSPRYFNAPLAIGTALTDGQRQELKDHLRSGMQIWANVRAPLINPLNGKIAGADPKSFKGVLQVTQWQDHSILLTSVLERHDLSEGDIITDIGFGVGGHYSVWASVFKDQWFPLSGADNNADSKIKVTTGNTPSGLMPKAASPSITEVSAHGIGHVQEAAKSSLASAISNDVIPMPISGAADKGNVDLPPDQYDALRIQRFIVLLHRDLSDGSIDALASRIADSFVYNGEKLSPDQIIAEQRGYRKQWPTLQDTPCKFTVWQRPDGSSDVNYLLMHRAENATTGLFFDATIDSNVKIVPLGDTFRIESLNTKILEKASGDLNLLEQPKVMVAQKFSGNAKDPGYNWPFILEVSKLENDGRFTGKISWLSLDSVHEVSGRFRQNMVSFAETAIITSGKAMIGAHYSASLTDDGSWDGSWSHVEKDRDIYMAGVWEMKPPAADGKQ